MELAELRRRQGRLEEAASLLDRAGASRAAQLCRARVALDRGESDLAAELGERCLRQAPADLKLQRLPALELLARAWTARRELEKAAAAIDGLREIERLVGTEPVRAGAQLAAGRLEARRGAHEQARPLLEDAVDRFERCRAPFEAAQARTELAGALLVLGRGRDGDCEALAARNELTALGAAVEAGHARRLLTEHTRRGGDPLSELTRREREVLGLLADGLTNRQVGERLVVSQHTVHRHVSNILRKLELPSRSAAVAVAVRRGLDGRPRQ